MPTTAGHVCDIGKTDRNGCLRIGVVAPGPDRAVGAEGQAVKSRCRDGLDVVQAGALGAPPFGGVLGDLWPGLLALRKNRIES